MNVERWRVVDARVLEKPLMPEALAVLRREIACVAPEAVVRQTGDYLEVLVPDVVTLSREPIS